jgi:hypothetical protein
MGTRGSSSLAGATSTWCRGWLGRDLQHVFAGWRDPGGEDWSPGLADDYLESHAAAADCFAPFAGFDPVAGLRDLAVEQPSVANLTCL